MSAPRDPGDLNRHPLDPHLSLGKRAGRLDISPDWILALVLIAGLIIMLVSIGSSPGTVAGQSNGSRVAVGMTPADGAIMLRIRSCGSETVESVSLKTVESDLTIWEAIAVEAQDRAIFVVGQAPTTFVETVTMIEELPRGVLLEGTILTQEPHTVQFYFADLLPNLWNYEGTYYPDDAIGRAIESASACSSGAPAVTAGRRTLMVVGFLIAAVSGAGILSRRIVSPDL